MKPKFVSWKFFGDGFQSSIENVNLLIVHDQTRIINASKCLDTKEGPVSFIEKELSKKKG